MKITWAALLPRGAKQPHPQEDRDTGEFVPPPREAASTLKVWPIVEREDRYRRVREQGQ